MNSAKIPALIVGATGKLGALITKHCLKQPNIEVSVLVRNPDKNKELVDEVQKAGGKVIVGDVTKPETLKDSTKDIHTVISALIGDNKTIVEGQQALLEDALKNNVKRFVPSDFSISLEKISEDEHPFLGDRIKFKKHLATTPIKGLHVSNGMFLETLFFFMSQGLYYYERPDQKIDFTSYEDTAKFVAAAVAKPDRTGELRIRGDELSINDMAAVYNRITGKNIVPQNRGTIEELKKAILEARQNGEFFKSILLNYNVPMFDGRGKLINVDNNEFSEIKPLIFEEFVKANPEKAKFPEN